MRLGAGRRLAREGQGKSGGFRSIILFRRGLKAFFVYGFSKRDQDDLAKAAKIGIATIRRIEGQDGPVMDGVRKLLKLRPKFRIGCEPVANRKGCVGSDAAELAPVSLDTTLFNGTEKERGS